jgi:two-component system sensor histidine kinase KdpD
VAKDGYVLNMLANVGFMPGLDTNAVSLIDVTREKAYEEDLRERAERLRDFLVVASHELRHPITIVKGYSHILADHMDTMPPEQVQDILQDITMSTDRLTRYVDQLLDISRIEQGKVVVERQPVDPGQLVEMALEDMAVMGRNNQFIKRVEAFDEKVALDPEKFVQLLNILLDNAVKFSPDGSPAEVDLERDGQMLVVSVLDHGSGIPEDSREKIFNRFYQVEDVAHHSKIGLGLGLYIARQLAQAHGGNIWVEPRIGGGSIFRFTVYAGSSDGKQT